MISNKILGISQAGGYTVYSIRPSTCGYRERHGCNYIPTPCLKGRGHLCDRFYPIKNFDKVNRSMRRRRRIPTLCKKILCSVLGHILHAREPQCWRCGKIANTAVPINEKE